ncbi:PHD finger-like domain-containing protein 5A isoform X1 [Loxodonta africana]|uniref:PHD finger-like domain-containing protein 5A isoform X1 n=1 Tax=Loxodonta africana TaxID=9785 RepID=UPI000C813BB2|nr:PHD finger-like domain-containing protein 5A isoform X1 [Loxodonta africana]XP_049740453.1 PHD finger-like domain-containing protein 5A isoform X1 [Elephas maximus indicus]
MEVSRTSHNDQEAGTMRVKALFVRTLILMVLYIFFALAAIGRLCEKCDGKCVICDSYVRPCTLVRICDECNYGSYQGRCVICGGPGVSDAYYCKECTIQEKDRDGCPKIVNLGSSKTDLFYERKKYGFKKR